MTWIALFSGVAFGAAVGWLAGFSRGFDEGLSVLAREDEYRP